MPPRKGFTLVELLLVVGILSMLMALLLPALSQARTRTKLFGCTGNERLQLASLRIYEANNGSQYFIRQLLLNDEMQLKKILICPETTVVQNAKIRYGTVATTWESADHTVHGSYAGNWWFSRPDMSGANIFVGKFYDRRVPVEEGSVPVFVDHIYCELIADETDTVPPEDKYTTFEQLAGAAIPRHNKSVNVAFWDGHVDPIKLPNLWTLRWKPNWKRDVPLATE